MAPIEVQKFAVGKFRVRDMCDSYDQYSSVNESSLGRCPNYSSALPFLGTVSDAFWYVGSSIGAHNQRLSSGSIFLSVLYDRNSHQIIQKSSAGDNCSKTETLS